MEAGGGKIDCGALRFKLNDSVIKYMRSDATQELFSQYREINRLCLCITIKMEHWVKIHRVILYVGCLHCQEKQHEIQNSHCTSEYQGASTVRIKVFFFHQCHKIFIYLDLSKDSLEKFVLIILIL